MEMITRIATVALIGVGSGMVSLPETVAAETVTYGNFEVTFYGNGEVFSSAYYDSTSSVKDWTNEMKDSVGRALNYWSDVITTDSAEKVKVAFVWEDLGSGTLGGATDVWYWDPFTGRTLSGAEATLRDSGNKSSFHNISSGETTAFVSLASNANFYYGESTTAIKSNQYDFQSVLVHEIGHIMGFNTFCRETGWTIAVGVTYRSQSESFLCVTELDTLLVAENGTGDLVSVFESSNSSVVPGYVNYQQVVEFSPGTEYYLKTGEGENGELELSTLKVYNPAHYSSGSSMSHVESRSPGSDEEPQMSYAIANGKIRRELSSEELSLLRAMGWTVSIPEPSAFGLFSGLLAVAWSSARRYRREIKF